MENNLTNIRKLATIAKIEEIKSIDGADNIEHVRVRGWWVVCKKGEYKVGDPCVYVEVDSIMPDGLPEEKQLAWKELNKQMSKATEEERIIIKQKMDEIVKHNTRPEFEFLRPVKFHIKTRRIFGQISQGICFPLSILDKFDTRFNPLYENSDVTDILGITQYTPPETAIMGGDVKGQLQAVGILISDEERIENLNSEYEELRKFRYFKTEKLDGTSFTAYLKNGQFGVCSRTLNYKQPNDDVDYNNMNVYWKMAKKYDLENKMREFQFMYNLGNFAIQGELVGENIQKNIYKLKGQQICFYNAFNIDSQEYWDYETFIKIINEMGLQTVPILDTNFELPEHALDLLEEADRTTTVFGNNPKQLIEGFVYVAKGEIPTTIRITRASYKRLSFKAKSRTFDMNK